MVSVNPACAPNDMESTGDLLDRLAREQDDVIDQLDGLLLRIDKVLQETLLEIRLESTAWTDETGGATDCRKAA